METSYLSAHAFSSADLQHGPMAMVDSDVPVIAVRSHGRGGDAAAGVIDRLRSMGADVLVVATRRRQPAVAGAGIDGT
jgi:glucosamine--fructose-6-phosphate aminotransferase (isomerizing)